MGSRVKLDYVLYVHYSTPAEGSVNGTDGEGAVSTSENEGEADCIAKNLVRGANGKCEEPDVRRNGVIGFKVETSQPINRVRSYISELNRMYSNSEENISKDPMFRSVTVGGLSDPGCAGNYKGIEELSLIIWNILSKLRYHVEFPLEM
ncbi:hypothetical protein PVBG_05769 [Plasmodium vivax Brazil I]|uniref:Uncharacterized protein n=1 Tax=Plasmodium vivax (strain Brazil I) TaxID=1033975 RepID=A0A0J9T2Y3_PLAV1|nr:hypothetical protein PVBG_05769 [Plasmodium vivax Brazil I]